MAQAGYTRIAVAALSGESSREYLSKLINRDSNLRELSFDISGSIDDINRISEGKAHIRGDACRSVCKHIQQ